MGTDGLACVSTTQHYCNIFVASGDQNSIVYVFSGFKSHASIRKKLAITSPTSGGRSVGIVRSQTQTMEFLFQIT
jgi:hypothetical protein